jgi:putative redox protein
MPTIETIYLGELRTEATHLLSGNRLTTDAPPDNQGRGEYFSPTDLVAASLGSCMVTVMGIAARTHNFNIDGARMVITKIMTSEAPRKIAEIVIDLTFPPGEYSEKVKKIIEFTVKNCPVALSLHPDIKQSVSLHYQL